MLSRRNEILIGLGLVALSALILWWLIPAYVALPRRVPVRALAPSFWPKIICWIMLLCGAALTIRAYLTAPPAAELDDTPTTDRGELLRLAGLFAILTVSYFALPVVGMVWTCIVAFVLLVAMTGRKNMVWGIIIGIALPLILYFFFSKVAGVAIPQGQFVRLP